MAKSTTRPPKSRTVAQFPQPAATVAVEDVPQEFQEVDEAPPQAAEPVTQPAPPPPRNPLKKKAPTSMPDGDFFAQVAKIPREDWGSRVFLYLYVLEPLCNLKQSGGKTYLNRYAEPVRDEHQVMLEYGSGRYRLMLSKAKVDPEASNELARYEFEIYNTSYPPKVPRAAWVNDSRNAKWEALLPKETPAGAAGTMVEAMKMYGEIRRDLKEEMEPDEQPTATTNEVLQTMKAAKELFAPATTALPAMPPVDPFDTAKKIMDMRGNDPMIAALMQRLDAADKAAEKARDREFELMKELRQTAATNAAPKGFLDQILELAQADKLEPIKKVVGLFTGNGDGEGIRRGRTTAYDMLRDIAATPFGANLGQGLGMLLVNVATRAQQPANGAPPMPQQPPIVINAQQPNGTIPPLEDAEHRIQRIGQQITQPMLYEFFLQNRGGDDFAQSMFDMWPEDYAFMRKLGAENIIARYRQFPPAWAVISPKEGAFTEFVQEFCKWDPNEDEAPAPGEDDGVVDLEAGS